MRCWKNKTFTNLNVWLRQCKHEKNTLPSLIRKLTSKARNVSDSGSHTTLITCLHLLRLSHKYRYLPSKKMTRLNKKASKAQDQIASARFVNGQLPQITVKKFIESSRKRTDPAKWLETVERHVKRMRSELGVQTTTEETPKLTVHPNFPAPAWIQTMHKSNRIRGVSRCVYLHTAHVVWYFPCSSHTQSHNPGKAKNTSARGGNPIKCSSCRPIWWLTITHLHHKQVEGILNTCWRPLGISVDEYDFGRRRTHNNYRRMIPWISRVQIGWELTESYWRCKDNADLACTLIGDGTEKRKMHIESMVTQMDNGHRLTFMPWPQADKAGM